jgi:hypothetical protein
MGVCPELLAFVAVTAVGCASAERSAFSGPAVPIAPIVTAQPPLAPAALAPAAISPARAPETAVAGPPPSWGAIYSRYFGPGTEGNCGSRGCHAGEIADAPSGYEWLARRGYIAGTQSALVLNNSCLRWFGGNMPPRGTTNDEATRDLVGWVAAGAQNN